MLIEPQVEPTRVMTVFRLYAQDARKLSHDRCALPGFQTPCLDVGLETVAAD